MAESIEADRNWAFSEVEWTIHWLTFPLALFHFARYYFLNIRNHSKIERQLRYKLRMKLLIPKALAISLLLVSLQTLAVIYGQDDRRDAYASPVKIQALFPAVAVAVGTSVLEKNKDGTYKVDMADSMEDFICRDERFAQQSSIGFCTGFLISDRLLVSAGHCGIATGSSSDPEQGFCNSEISWYFGYNISKYSTQKPHLNINADQLYSCKRLIRIENTGTTNNPETDFALIELDRSVSVATPLQIANKSVRVQDRVFTIGHPMGMPAKYSGSAAVLQNENPFYFEANLDTQSGNSGGPVFDSENKVVGILVGGYPEDLAKDKKDVCSRFNRCDDSGLVCKKQASPGIVQVSNSVQRIEYVLPFIEKN
jgi:V8-like Glu-specific endopeptidase